MKRRHFIAAAAALPLFGKASFAASSQTLNYEPGLVDQALAEGKTVFIDFGTEWCSTCNRQKRTVNALRSANPEYDEAMTFVYVDWDIYSRDDLSKRLGIPRRSTLVVLKGDAELGRIVAGTSKSDIQELMDIGLQAATA